MPAILKEVCEGPIVPPRKRMQELGVSVDCPPAFDQWFMQCVNVNPAQRFQHARDAVRALGHALGCAARESQPPKEVALPSRTRATLGRPRLRWIALCSFAAMLALGAVFVRRPRSLPAITDSAKVVPPRPAQASFEPQTDPPPTVLSAQFAPTIASTSSPLVGSNKRGGRRPASAPIRVPPSGSAVDPRANQHPNDPASESPPPAPLNFDKLTGPAPSTQPGPVRSGHDPFENPP
jgi:hypothetical protein